MNRLFIISSFVKQNGLNINREKKIDVVINLTKNSTILNSQLREEMLSEYEFYESISTKSIKDYISFVSQISNAKFNNGKTLRDLRFDTLPIYWLTPLSIKHPYNHWLFNLFLLRNYLQKEASKTHQNFIFLPKKITHIKEFVNDFLKETNTEVICESNKVIRSNNSSLNFIKTNLTFIFKILFIKSSTEKNVKTKNIFLVGNNSNSYLKKVYSILNPNKDFSLKILPFQDWYKTSSIHKDLYLHKPNFTELFSTFLTLYKQTIKQSSLNSIIKVDGITINTDIILKEMNDIIIYNSHYFYSYIWLKRYFSSKKEPLNFFYEDEFYEIGRVISAAKNSSLNPKITTYGVQHGMFSDFHTVYTLTNNELLETENGKKNEIPIPDYFITWGNYFSTQFLKHNTVLKNKIKEFGNPLYLFNNNSHRENKKDYNILYCLTSEALFHKEITIVKKILNQHPNSILILRNHPNFQFKIDTNIFNVKVKISTQKEIKDDFKTSNLVLTSAHSTIFLDALAYNIKVIRLKTEIYDESMDIVTPNCITLNKKSKYPLNHKENISDITSFLNMDNKKWINLLT